MNRILKEVNDNGFVDASSVFIDGTHIKASANRNKKEKVIVNKPVKQYREELEQEIQADRKKHDKKPMKKDISDPEQKTISKSTTDPESGLFVKGEHERCFAYVANTACDCHNFILDFELGAGNIHDSQMFHELYKKLKDKIPQTEVIAVDSGYKTPGIMKEIVDSGKIPAVPYKRPMTKDGFFKKYEYAYDEYYDCYVCPGNEVLKYTTTNRDGYCEYKSNPAICKNCKIIGRCTASKEKTKIVTRHVWADYMEEAEEYRYIPKYREIYKLRSQTIERVFADAKEKHAMRYTQLRGLEKVRMQVTLTFACMNLKKLALWKKRTGKLPPAAAMALDSFKTYCYFQLKIFRNSWIHDKESFCCG